MKIAITGKMCAGKSTLANLIQQIDSRYEIYSFGQKVKDIAYDLFDMKEKDRTLLVSIGTKMREINPDVWINYIIHKTKNKKFCIIDDLRYQNEYEALIKNNFIIIQINISPELQKERIKDLYPNNYQDHILNIEHESEKNEFQWIHIPNISFNANEDIQNIKQIIKNFMKE